MKNPDIIITIDLEWFDNDPRLFKADINQRRIYSEGYIRSAVDTILDICSRNGSKLTFFILGEIYDAYPDLIHTIEKKGHDIAYHTHSHKNIYNKDILEQELKLSRNFIEEFRIKGFRSPKIRMDKDCLNVLEDHGFEYDSSVYGTKRFKFGNMTILPVSTYPYFKKQYVNYPNPLTFNLLTESIPFGSGLFLGLIKNNVTYFINKYFDVYEEPAIMLMHSWQIVRPDTSLRFKIKKPFVIPYLVSLSDTLNNVTRQFKTLKMCDYIIKD